MTAMAFILLGLALLVLECVIPGGILGVIGYVVLMYGIYDISGGGIDGVLWMVGISLLVFLLGLWVINFFPNSWMGRKLTLKKRSDSADGYVSNDTQNKLVGLRGTAHSTLRPAGIASINGQFVDVVTEGEFVELGTPIVVSKVIGGRTIVRPLAED